MGPENSNNADVQADLSLYSMTILSKLFYI